LDVNLLDQRGEVVDVVSPYTQMQGHPTYVYGLTEAAHRHRMILVETMLAVGFSNCRDEWWHYSYGDAGWAVRTGETECFYGKLDMDPENFAEQEKEWISRMTTRENPFLKG
jgi:D-alanyl-D-alanine dipeptidase